MAHLGRGMPGHRPDAAKGATAAVGEESGVAQDRRGLRGPAIRSIAMDPDPDPTDDPHRLPQADLMAALRLALARDGALLTAGENMLMESFFALPEPARALYARLLARQPGPFPLGDLHYPEIPEIGLASAQLVAAGLAWAAERLLPTTRLLQRQTAAEIRVALRALGLPSTGAKADLVARLAEAGGGAVRQQPWLLLRHRGLMRRLLRLALSDHHGDLSRLVVARLGLVRFPHTHRRRGASSPIGAPCWPMSRGRPPRSGRRGPACDAPDTSSASRRRRRPTPCGGASAGAASTRPWRWGRPPSWSGPGAPTRPPGSIGLIAADALPMPPARLRLALCLRPWGPWAPAPGSRAEGLALPLEAVQADPACGP